MVAAPFYVWSKKFTTIILIVSKIFCGNLFGSKDTELMISLIWFYSIVDVAKKDGDIF